jgi:hypothetical protein
MSVKPRCSVPLRRDLAIDTLGWDLVHLEQRTWCLLS